MAVAVAMNGPIPDSERFIELVEPVMASSGKRTPSRPRRSSARGLQIFTPATLHDKLEEHEAREFAARVVTVPVHNNNNNNHDGVEDDVDGEGDRDVERFYSPLSSPAILSQEQVNPTKQKTSKQQSRNRTSEIPVFPVHNSNSGKESGVNRAFRSKVGANGSISLSILPSAAALSDMLEQKATIRNDLLHGTYQPASEFAISNSTLGALPIPAARRPSAVSTNGSVNTRPLTIKRKKPAIYDPEQSALPVSRAASIDACTPTSEDGGLSSAQGSPRKRSDIALPVSQTFQTPLRRIPQSDVSPPSTPPTWTSSTHSDTYTEEDSLPISPRSSASRKQDPQTPSLKSRKLQYGHQEEEGEDVSSSNYANGDRTIVPDIPRRGNKDHVDLDYLMPIVCDLEAMQDRPGMLRRESDDSTDIDDEEDEDDDDEDASVHNFGLDSFPVPSVILTSPKNTPRMYPVSPTLVDHLTSGPTQRKVSIASSLSRLQPKTDLYPIPTNADGKQEWDQATELEIRDRVFRAEIKKPNKADKLRRKALQKQFDQFKKPTKLELYEASLLSVRDENGHKVRFGSLFEEKKTVVCFIRHFWCSQCQNYVDAITRIRPEVLAKFNMNLVIVSNGSWKMIKSYRKLLGNKCPYPIYTDRAKHLYTALGMTLRTWDGGKEKDRGNYIQHSLGASVIVGIKSGVKLPMRPPGDQQQLGGEFILGPGLEISFAHRMKTTRGHAEIEQVLASAGINLDEETKLLGLSASPASYRDGGSTPTMSNGNNRNSAFSSSNGISSMPNSPSLAYSIMNRLTNSRHSTSSPPGSPTVSSTGGIGGGQSSQNSTVGVGRTRSNRLQKKNRKSQHGLNASSVTQSPLGISSNDLRTEEVDIAEEEGGGENKLSHRPISSITLPENSKSRYSNMKGIDELREEAEERFKRDSLRNRNRKHSSAPLPVLPTSFTTSTSAIPMYIPSHFPSSADTAEVPPKIPTPSSMTPLSMGFLSTPSTTPPLFSSTEAPPTIPKRRSNIQSQTRESYRDSTDIDQIYDGYLNVSNGYDNGEMRMENRNVVDGELHPQSSRFSESSDNDEDEEVNGKNRKTTKMVSNKQKRNRLSKRNSNTAFLNQQTSSSSSNSLNRPGSFVRSLNLKSSSSGLKN